MGIIANTKRRWSKIQDFFRLYTTGMNRQEIEQLLKKDTLGALDYLKRGSEVAPETEGEPGGRRMVKIIKQMFISFIMRLTPARRLVYGVAVVAFVLGLINRDLFYLFSGFALMNLLLALELVDKLTTRDELEIAREIQMSLQPVQMPDLRLLSVAAFSKPAREVGGDFFAFVQPAPDKLISIVGDVSEKGISAALYAAYAQSMFESLSETRTTPSGIFNSLNDLISKRLRDGDFITAVIALFDMAENSVTIARAGHNWPLYYSAKKGIITELKPKGISIGLAENKVFGAAMEEQKVQFDKGDLVLLYSDGITEAMDSQDRMFDLPGLKTAVQESIGQSSDEIISRINFRLHEFIRDTEPHDDSTLVAVKMV